MRQAGSPEATTQPDSPPADSSKAQRVRLVDVHKAFGSLVVLDGLTMELRPGRNTVVLGPSGTGKSVLLKHVAGLLKPDKGEVWFDGQRIDNLREREMVAVRKRMGYLFQMAALFDSMNVEQNICFPLREHTTWSVSEQQDRCEKVLRMVGLPGIQGKMPAELSGGQRKRVALARAIVLEPALILYDEPTTGLDPISAGLIDELIISMRDRLNITGLVVTHDIQSALKVADRMIMLNKGKIVADAPVEQFPDLEVDFVQRFLKGEADQEDLQRIRQGF